MLVRRVVFGGWCRPRAHTACGETSPSGLSLKPPMRRGGPEAWELWPVGRTHPSKQASLPGQPSLSTWPSPWCGREGRPSRPSRSGQGGPPPFQGPRLGPGPTLGDAGAHAGGSQALGVLGRRGGGPGTRGPALWLTRCPHWGREGAAGHAWGGAGPRRGGLGAGVRRWPCSDSSATPSFPSQPEGKIGCTAHHRVESH